MNPHHLPFNAGSHAIPPPAWVPNPAYFSAYGRYPPVPAAGEGSSYSLLPPSVAPAPFVAAPGVAPGLAAASVLPASAAPGLAAASVLPPATALAHSPAVAMRPQTSEDVSSDDEDEPLSTWVKRGRKRKAAKDVKKSSSSEKRKKSSCDKHDGVVVVEKPSVGSSVQSAPPRSRACDRRVVDEVLEDAGMPDNNERRRTVEEISMALVKKGLSAISKAGNEFIMNSTATTKKYAALKKKTVSDFRLSLLKDDNLKDLAYLEQIPGMPEGYVRERFYDACSGMKTPVKTEIINKAVLNYIEHFAKSTKKTGEPIQPNTIQNRLKILFAYFKGQGIIYSLSTDFNFDSGINAVLKNRFSIIAKEDSTYGTRITKRTITETDEAGIRKAVKKGTLDLSNPQDIQIILNFLLGKYFCLRGRTEHAKIKWESIKFGVHEDGPDVGTPYVELVKDSTGDKTHKLDIRNPYVPYAAALYVKSTWYTHNHRDNLSLWTVLRKYRNMCPNTQERLYCFPAYKTLLKEYQAHGKPHLKIDPARPIGANTIGGFAKILATRANLPNPDKVTSHGWRQYGITCMVSAGVSAAESQGAARHASVTSQQPYMATNRKSEAARQRAMSYIPYEKV